MKKPLLSFLIMIIFLILLQDSLFAGSYRFKYNLKPGQKWLCTVSTMGENRMSGKKSIDRSKTKIQYRVFKGSKKGWVRLEAHIAFQGKNAGTLDMSKITYSAAFHQSGEIRGIKYSGSCMPDLGANAADIPEETLKMMEQSYKMIPEAMKNMVFWFPEFPEIKLGIGDEFDFKQRMGTGTTGDPMQTQSAMKQTFVLEDVSKGLAYFTVKDRSVSKISTMGNKCKVKSAGKGDALFDMKQGMWVEWTEKSLTKIGMGKSAGSKTRNNTLKNITKFEMELQ